MSELNESGGTKLVILPLRRLRQMNYKFWVRLDYTARSVPRKKKSERQMGIKSVQAGLCFTLTVVSKVSKDLSQSRRIL